MTESISIASDDCNLDSIRLHGRTRRVAELVVRLLADDNPQTLRQLYYRVVSAGAIENTQAAYHGLGALVTRLREAGIVPYGWLADSTRNTIAAQTWPNLRDFRDTIEAAYRRDPWRDQPAHVCLIIEKDAIASVLRPIADEFAVPIHPLRGYGSLSYKHEIARAWAEIEKPVVAYYCGDYDASGLDIERDVQDSIARMSGRDFTLRRLALLPTDFAEFDLIRIAIKKSDRRAAAFRRRCPQGGGEVDALPAGELRRRVREAIESHIDYRAWKLAEAAEAADRERLAEVVAGFGDSGD